MSRILFVLALGLSAAACPTLASAQDAHASETSSSADQAFFDFQVDQTARVKVAKAPVYPDRMRLSNIEGQVIVQFVVDESGTAQMSTFKVLKASDNELAESVRRAVSASSYFPAEVHGRKVRQLVQQPYKFAPRA